MPDNLTQAQVHLRDAQRQLDVAQEKLELSQAELTQAVKEDSAENLVKILDAALADARIARDNAAKAVEDARQTLQYLIRESHRTAGEASLLCSVPIV